MKKYFAIKGSTKDFIKVSTGYEKGGISIWNGNNYRRGYYVYVTPVERESRDGYSTESCGLFDGYKQILKEVGRRGKKAEEESENMALNVAMPIVNRVAQEKGWEIEGD